MSRRSRRNRTAEVTRLRLDGAQPRLDDVAARWSVSPAQTRWSLWILFVFSLLILTVGARTQNQAIQVPLVEWLNNRSLYPQDPFMIALARYPSALWPSVALIARFFPLEGTLLVLNILEKLFVLYAAGRLARAFVPRSLLAVVAATALFAFPLESFVGNGTICERYLEQTGLSIPCFLLAAAAFYERRPIAWAIWLGVGFDLTPMYGAFALTYFAAAFAIDVAWRDAWRSWARAVFLFLVVASYGLHASIAAGAGPPADDAVWVEAALIRCWSHVYPMTWGWEPFIRFTVFLGLFVGTVFAARRAQPRLFRYGIAWTIVACLWMIDAFVAPYVLHSRRLMMMQPARATDLLVCFAGIAMISIAAERLEPRPGFERNRLGWLLGLGASILVWEVPGSWTVAVVLLVAAVPPVWRGLTRMISPRRLAWLLVVWVACVGARTGHARSSEGEDPLFHVPGRSMRKLAEWVKQHTPADAVFLVNPSDDVRLNHFMGLAERSIFTSTEEGTAAYWAPDFASDWIERLRALGILPVYRSPRSLDHDFDHAFSKLRDDDVVDLRKHYRVDYWIVPRHRQSSFRVVWADNDYAILQVP